MDFQSAMETFAEAWVAANAGTQVNFYRNNKVAVYIVNLEMSVSGGCDSNF